MELAKEQIKEFAIWLDLEDIRKFIKDNQEEYNTFEKLERQAFIFGTYIILTKFKKLNKQKKTFELLEMVLYSKERK